MKGKTRAWKRRFRAKSNTCCLIPFLNQTKQTLHRNPSWWTKRRRDHQGPAGRNSRLGYSNGRLFSSRRENHAVGRLSHGRHVSARVKVAESCWRTKRLKGEEPSFITGVNLVKLRNWKVSWTFYRLLIMCQMPRALALWRASSSWQPPRGCLPLLTPFYRCETWRTKRLGTLLRVPQPVLSKSGSRPHSNL